ncbi:MAG: STAS domain-containing protein [Pseudomonadota bacterium]|nr:STAS domain-containing protein [Pseudomonadota bacterium]
MTLSVTGALTFASVPEWRRQGRRFIAQDAAPQFDFAEVQQSDSSGVALLLAWLRDAKAAEKNVLFINLPQQLLDVASVCGVLFLLEQVSKKNG